MNTSDNNYIIGVSGLLEGIITTKLHQSSVETTSHQIWSAIPEGMPETIEPPGLDYDRRVYLAKDIREFCTEETRDLVCPLVPGRYRFNLAY